MCSPPPLPYCLSNGWLLKAVEGRPFLSTALLIFHRETSPFFSLIPSPVFPFKPLAAPVVLLFSFTPTLPLSIFSLKFPSGHGSALGARCSPRKQIRRAPSFCFDPFPMLLSPSLWAGGLLSYMARSLGLCSQVVSLRSDTGRNSGVGVRGSADGGTAGAQQQQWCSWLQRAFAGCHGRQVADSLFLPLRD